MSKKQEIPKDYCIIQLTSIEEDITGIGIIKVRSNTPVLSYMVDTKIESLDPIIPRVLEIMENDTIYYISKDTKLDLLKRKCEERQMPINNELIDGKKVLSDIGRSQRDFICNCLELKVRM